MIVEPQKLFIEKERFLIKYEHIRLTHFLFHVIGALPEQPLAVARIRRVLDLGCAVGTWTSEFALSHRGSQLVGLDDDPGLLAEARRDACKRGISNVDYQVTADRAGPFALPDASFDVIHLQQPLLSYHAWPGLLKECYRLLRPGGWLCLVTWDQPMTNAPAWETFSHLTLQAMEHAGSLRWQSERHTGLCCDLEPFCRQAGFQERLLFPRWINFSFAAPLYEEWAQVQLNAYQADALIRHAGLASESELNTLHRRRKWEMHLPTFHALLPMLTLWASRTEANE